MKTNFKSKYVEVFGTPIPHEPFLTYFNHESVTEEADKVLQGTFLFPPVINPDIVEFSDCIKMSDEIKNAPPIKIETTYEDYYKFWKQGREKISSSMSGIHNGHHIAASLSTLMGTIMAILASVPWIIGCTLNRWKCSLNAALKNSRS